MFAARGGFVYVSGTVSIPINWYDYDRANFEPIATGLTGGTPTFSTATITGFAGNDNRYRSAVLHPNGNIYCLPRSSASGMLEIDPVNQTSSYKTFGNLSQYNSTTGNYFHSAVLAENGNIIGIPFTYDKIIEVDVVNQTTTEISYGATPTGTAKWTGAVLGPNGNVYGIPQSTSTGVFLIYNPSTKTATTSNLGAKITTTSAFFGGTRSYKDDKIYCAPLRQGNVVIIDATNGTATNQTWGLTWPTGTNNYYGSACDKYGNVYFLAGESGITSRKIDPDANAVYGVNHTSLSFGCIMGSDGNIYNIPRTSGTINKFDPIANTSTTINSTIRSMSGAVVTLNGNIVMLPDTSANVTSAFVNCAGSLQSVTNNANLILSPYVNGGRI